MEPNSDPGRRLQIDAIRRMSPEQRLAKAFDLHDFARELFLHGLRRRFPDAKDDEIKAIYLERIEICHNRNY